METNTKIVQAILLFLFFTIFKVSATEIFPSEEVGDFIIGKDASVSEIAPEILEEVVLELEFEVSNDWSNLLGGMMLQLILLLLIS